MMGSGLRFSMASTIIVVLMILGMTGCAFFESSRSFSDSSGSVSDSIGSSSDSSGSSSGGDAESQAYREDVRALASAIARLNGQPDALRRGLSELALERGISDWEAIAITFGAVGEGLARVDISEDELLAYQTVLARPGSANFEAIGAGFAAPLP